MSHRQAHLAEAQAEEREKQWRLLSLEWEERLNKATAQLGRLEGELLAVRETILEFVKTRVRSPFKQWDFYSADAFMAITNAHANLNGLAEQIRAGIRAAERERCAALHESISPACDHELALQDPGAGAIGAIIAYRDAIRGLK